MAFSPDPNRAPAPSAVIAPERDDERLGREHAGQEQRVGARSKLGRRGLLAAGALGLCAAGAAATPYVAERLQEAGRAAVIAEWSHAPNVGYYVKDYGAKGDGVTDDTAAFTRALSAANAAGGGVVYVPAGTFITTTLTLYPYVHLVGAGISATKLKLKSGTNADLIQRDVASISLYAAQGTGSDGIGNWSIRDLTLDGNKAHQTAGPSYCLRAYSYGFILDSVRIANGYTGGVLLDWNGPGVPEPDSMEATIINSKIHDNNGIGLTWAGPHDSVMVNTIVYRSASHNLYIAPHGPGLGVIACHFWGSAVGSNSVAVLVEGDSCLFVGTQIEGSDVAQIAILASYCTIAGCQIYGIDRYPAVGIQIGQTAGGKPYNASNFHTAGRTTLVSVYGCCIDCIIKHCGNVSRGAVWLASEYEQNSIRASIWLPATGMALEGTPAPGDQLALAVFGPGATGPFSLLTTGGTFALGQSLSAASVAPGGTIALVGQSMVRITAAEAVTDVILTAGSYAGQVVTVVNESANTLAFAPAATSHVADGASDVIPANAARGFVWNSGTRLWYRLA